MRSWCLFSPKIIFSSSKHIFRVSLLILWWRQVWLSVHKCHKSFMNTCLPFLALFEFPALFTVPLLTYWQRHSESATTKASETPRNLSLTGVWTQNMIMKALTALFCLFVAVRGLDNESCEDRGKYVPRHTNFTAEGKNSWSGSGRWFTRLVIPAFWPTFYLSSSKK